MRSMATKQIWIELDHGSQTKNLLLAYRTSSQDTASMMAMLRKQALALMMETVVHPTHHMYPPRSLVI